MTKKEVQVIIEENPGKQLYVSHGAADGGISIGLHEPISKSRAIRAARFFHSVRFGTYRQERPDLQRYFDRDGGPHAGGSRCTGRSSDHQTGGVPMKTIVRPLDRKLSEEEIRTLREIYAEVPPVPGCKGLSATIPARRFLSSRRSSSS